MRRHALAMVLAVCLGAFMAAAIVGCSSPTGSSGTTGTGSGRMGGGSSGGPGGSTGSSGGGMMGGQSGTSAYSSPGQRIWLTGVGADGRTISHTAPRTSQGALMMGGGGCASCHGADGRGGTIRMMMGPAINAPDVTYAALIKAGFTGTTIRKAIVDGLDESGKPLNAAMPRWRMNGADLNETIAYLKELSSR